MRTRRHRLYIFRMACFAITMGLVYTTLYWVLYRQLSWRVSSETVIAFAFSYVLIDLWNGRLQPVDKASREQLPTLVK